MKIFRKSLFGYKKQDVLQYMDEVVDKLVLVKNKHQAEVGALKNSKDVAEQKLKETKAQLTQACAEKQQVEGELLSMTEQYEQLMQKYEMDYLSKKEEIDAAGKTILQVQNLCDQMIADAKEETEKLVAQAKRDAEECRAVLDNCSQTYSATKSNILKYLSSFEEELDSLSYMIERKEDETVGKSEFEEVRRRNVKKLDELKRSFMHIVHKEEA